MLMRKNYFFKYVLAMLVLTLWGTAKADVISSVFTDKNMSVGDGELVWTSTIMPNNFDKPNATATYESRGLQLGTSKNPAGVITFTSASSLTKVTEVKITASASGEGNTLAVKVGDTDFAGDGAILSETSNANKVYTFTGEAADGVITIAIDNNTKAVYIKSIEVTYVNDGGETPVDPQPDPVEVAAPVLSPTTGYLANAVDVTITAEEGLTVYYTTDGTEPTVESAVYSEPINITAVDEKVVVTVKAIAVDGEGNKSEVASFTYNVLVVKPMEVPEGCVGFDFVMNPWGFVLGSNGGETGDIETPIVQDGMTLTVDNGTANTNTRMWNYNAGGQLRAYKNSTFTIAAPEGKVITKVEFNIANKGTLSTEQGSLNGGEWIGQESSVTFAVTANIQIATILVTLADGEAVYVEAPVITPETGTFFEAQTVTITAEEGLKIYYYIGEDAETAQEYTEPFAVSETTTVTAWAVDADGNKSNTVTSVLTIESLPEYATIAAMKEAATTDKVKAAFKFENLLVTGVAKTSLYVSDGTDGFLLYGIAPTVKKGDKISGTITGDLYLYNGLTEMAVAGYDGVTVVSEGNEVEPVVVTIAPDGTISITYAPGVAMIYAETAETENYLASKVGFVYAAISGSGQLEMPYIVSDASFLYGTKYLTGDKVWVSGYVVGYVDGQNINSGAVFAAPATEDVKTNLLLADNPEETDVTKCIPVQLPKGFVREGLQPSVNYKSMVWLYGNIDKYFGVAGIKSVSDYSKDGKELATGIETVEVEDAPKSIYTLAGQKVDVITKGGVYIIDGKKVLVK